MGDSTERQLSGTFELSLRDMDIKICHAAKYFLLQLQVYFLEIATIFLVNILST